jgi:hypothetical protein
MGEFKRRAHRTYHMWCVVELVTKLHVKQGVLGSNFTHHKKRSLEFKLFFSSEDGL